MPIDVIGHRGWRSRFPDNTLPGLVAAAGVCDAVEVDVRRSGDGKLVLAHDPMIGNVEVATSPWSELGEIDLGAGAKPCLLDEVLGALPDTPLLVEIKNAPGVSGYEPDHRLALEAAGRIRPNDTLISFNWETVARARETYPELRTGINVGILGDLAEAIRVGRESGHAVLVPDVDLITGSEVRLPDDLTVYVWSSRQGESFDAVIDELVSRGVSGIISDDPKRTRELLRSRQ